LGAPEPSRPGFGGAWGQYFEGLVLALRLLAMLVAANSGQHCSKIIYAKRSPIPRFVRYSTKRLRWRCDAGSRVLPG